MKGREKKTPVCRSDELRQQDDNLWSCRQEKRSVLERRILNVGVEGVVNGRKKGHTDTSSLKSPTANNLGNYA